MPGYSNFSLWIPIAAVKNYELLFPHGPTLAQKPLYLVGTILKVFWCQTRLHLVSLLQTLIPIHMTVHEDSSGLPEMFI